MQSPWKHFSWEELACRCGCGRADMDPIFMARLMRLREIVDRPFAINSGYRCQDHNERVSRTKSRTGPHTQGKAVDILARGDLVFPMLQHLEPLGFTGVGWQQRGEGRFIHIDDCQAGENQPRPWVWSY